MVLLLPLLQSTTTKTTITVSAFRPSILLVRHWRNINNKKKLPHTTTTDSSIFNTNLFRSTTIAGTTTTTSLAFGGGSRCCNTGTTIISGSTTTSFHRHRLFGDRTQNQMQQSNNKSMSKKLHSPSSSLSASVNNVNDNESDNRKQQDQNLNNKHLVIIIAGVTGVGKSDVASFICHSNNGIIISADSVQVYKNVNIGSNKPTTEEQKQTPHILIDLIDGDGAGDDNGDGDNNGDGFDGNGNVDGSSSNNNKYNAADWRNDAIYTIQSLLSSQQEEDESNNEEEGQDDEEDDVDAQTKRNIRRNIIQKSIEQARALKGCEPNQKVLPVICGGTMMYLQWLVHGRPDIMKPSNTALTKSMDIINKYQNQNNQENSNNTTATAPTITEGNATTSNTSTASSSGWIDAVNFVSSFGTIFQQRVDKLCGEDWYRLRRILEVAYTIEEEMKKEKKQNQKQQATSNNHSDDIADNEKKSDSIINTAQEKLLNTLYTGQRHGSLQTIDDGMYDVRCFFLCPNDRMKHTKTIDKRCEQMLQMGLLNETCNLYISNKLPQMTTKAIGYRQVLDYFLTDDKKQKQSKVRCNNNNNNNNNNSNEKNDKDRDYYQDEVVAFNSFLDDFTTATRRYAKKQMSWFRKDPNFLFLPVSLDIEEKEERVKNTATMIQELCSLSREEYEKALSDENGISYQTKQMNEKQGKGMKYYQFERHILKDGTKELEAVINEAINCHNQIDRHNNQIVNVKRRRKCEEEEDI